MHFFIDANLPRGSADAIRHSGHDATDCRDVGLGSADDARIASYAKDNGYVILTRDGDFGDIRNYPPDQYHGIVVMSVPDDAVASQIIALIKSFVEQRPVIDQLSGRLAVLAPGSVRLRPAVI